jgi:4-deoxy-L-threo-5-hexosulose-uronate ketol-isomerase
MYTRYATHPEDFKNYDTEKIRKEFLIEHIFIEECVTSVYSLNDRLIIGGANPVKKELRLETAEQLKSKFFLERREIGIINVGAAGTVSVDGSVYTLQNKEALYIGRGAKDVVFQPSKSGTALFYYNSAPAHASYPTRVVTSKEAEVVTLGSPETANHRTINKLIVNSVVPTCQLQMGLTELKPGSVWNTMPPHTHDRRMEAYFYFDLMNNHTISHFMGTPQETRHIFVRNHQAVISPAWSIHCGAGTSNYSFVWGMAGENLDYSDMDVVGPHELK